MNQKTTEKRVIQRRQGAEEKTRRLKIKETKRKAKSLLILIPLKSQRGTFKPISYSRALITNNTAQVEEKYLFKQKCLHFNEHLRDKIFGLIPWTCATRFCFVFVYL